MKKIHYTFALLMMAQFSFGQSFSLLKKGVNISKTSIMITGSPDDEELVAHDIEVVNSSSLPKDVRVKRYEIAYVPDTYNFICWGICESPFNHQAGKNPFYILNTTVNITTSHFDFSGHYLPQGTKGSSEYRYVFYDIKNPTDSTWFNVVYSTNLSSNNETQAENNLKVYPNPSSDKIFVETNIQTNGILILSNILGQIIDYQYFTSNKIAVLNFQDSPKGVYVLTLKTDNGNLSRKIVKE
jgi:hypothetical protein